MKVSSSKTESRALNVLESIIDDHNTMTYHFESDDKEMSWDGFIWLNKLDNGDISKANTDSRVAVQIKGHNDPAEKYVNKNSITYPVDLDDLKLYSTEKGIVYFQIFLSTTKKEIFYSSLYPSRISDYIEEADKRGNVASISIPFYKLVKDPEKLFIIVKQFSEEAKYQGSSFNPIVKDRIRSTDFERLTEINLTVVGSTDIFDVLKRLSTGDICLKGKIDKNDKYFRPLEWHDKSIFYSGREVKQSITINGIVYYDKYRCVVDSNQNIVLYPSPNLELRITEGKFNFKTVSSLKELSNDAKFLLSLYSADSYYIQEQRFGITDQHIDEGFERKLHFLVDLYNATEAIGISDRIIFNELTDDQYKSLVILINLYLGTYNHKFTELYSRYNWKFGDKDYPLLIIKTDNGIEITSAVYTKKYVVLLPNDDIEPTKWYRMPLFAYQEPHVLANLIYCDFEEFEKQILDSEINEFSSGALNECALTLINAYDLSKNPRFLSLANIIMDKIIMVCDSDMERLNKLQIKYRMGGLEQDDYLYLRGIATDDYHIKFGASVLLEDYESGRQYFEKFTPDEKNLYQKFPIYTLYLRLQNKMHL